VRTFAGVEDSKPLSSALPSAMFETKLRTTCANCGASHGLFGSEPLQPAYFLFADHAEVCGFGPIERSTLPIRAGPPWKEESSGLLLIGEIGFEE
jgi:hypothetical protein